MVGPTSGTEIIEGDYRIIIPGTDDDASYPYTNISRGLDEQTLMMMLLAQSGQLESKRPFRLRKVSGGTTSGWKWPIGPPCTGYIPFGSNRPGDPTLWRGRFILMWLTGNGDTFDYSNTADLVWNEGIPSSQLPPPPPSISELTRVIPQNPD